MMDYWKTALTLIAGCVVAWLLYGASLKAYISKNDDHGTTVTIVAMFGTFLPFMGFALISIGFVNMSRVDECRRLQDEAFDRWVENAKSSDTVPPSYVTPDCP